MTAIIWHQFQNGAKVFGGCSVLKWNTKERQRNWSSSWILALIVGLGGGFQKVIPSGHFILFSTFTCSRTESIGINFSFSSFFLRIEFVCDWEVESDVKVRVLAQPFCGSTRTETLQRDDYSWAGIHCMKCSENKNTFPKCQNWVKRHVTKNVEQYTRYVFRHSNNGGIFE